MIHRFSRPHAFAAILNCGLAVCFCLAAGCGQRVVGPTAPASISPTAVPSGPVAGVPLSINPQVAQKPPAATSVLPRVPAGSAMSLPATAEQGRYHEVRSGDTIGRLAQQYGVSSSVIIDANGLDTPDTIQPGQLIYIPAGR